MRRFGRGLGWAAVGVALLGLVLRAADVRGTVPLAQLMFPAFGVGTVALALVALLTRRGWFAVTAGTLAVTYLAVAGTAVLPRTVDPGPDDLVVLAANLDSGHVRPAPLRELVRRRAADVIVLSEVTPEALARIDTDALAHEYPHRVGRARPGAAGTMVLSRLDLRVVDADVNDLAYDQPTVEVEKAGRTVRVRGVHVYPPTREGSRRWRYQLGWLERWRAAQPDDRPLVMAGDFKSSQAHPAFRDIVGPMTDATREAGAGWPGTWPAQWFTTFAGLDHVLVQGLGVVDAGTDEVGGSDHRAVWARLRTG